LAILKYNSELKLLMEQKIAMSQVAFKSEWALAKFFKAYFDNEEIKEKFDLKYILGREKSKPEAISALICGLRARVKILEKNPEWRNEQRLAEMNSILDIIEGLQSGSIDYFSVHGTHLVPPEVYDNVELSIIHSQNKTHLEYILDGLNNHKSILCEKPLVPTVMADGRADKEGIQRLEEIIETAPKDLTLMDAEHYSYKPGSLRFYQNLTEILTDDNGNPLKIKKIEGECKEIDDPTHNRTKSILDFKTSGTGLMGDTMCHLLAFISNLGGKAIPEFREYDMYHDTKNGFQYNADTYNHVDFKVQNRENGINDSVTIPAREYFTEDCTASFEVAKFINLMKIAGEETEEKPKESKFIRFTLEDDSQVTINFRNGVVNRKYSPGVSREYRKEDEKISSNEYVNILNHIHDSIRQGKKPITDFRNSAVTLRSIMESYALPEEVNKKVEIYQQNAN
jgi:predicted dehydrogenase